MTSAQVDTTMGVRWMSDAEACVLIARARLPFHDCASWSGRLITLK